jgi:uncharacterized integral membrane protein (TIGR00697 family)
MNNFKLQILFSIFICLIVWMNLLGWKIVDLFWVPVSVGIFMVPLTFLITDIVADVYWKKTVNIFIVWWALSLVVMFTFTIIFVYLEPHSRYDFNNEYKVIFGSSLRMIVASFIAFIISQFHDIITFEWLKKKTNWKHLWFRNNFSTIISQFIDTFIFMMIAFYQISPKFTFMFIISMSIPYYLFKVLFALIDTPFVYLGIKWLKK